MSFPRLVLVCLIATTAFGCAKKGNNTERADGTCTDSYLSSHNSMASAAKDVLRNCSNSGSGFGYSSSRSYCESSASGLLQQCDAYQATHKAGRTCRAMDSASWTEITVNTSTIHDACNTLRKVSRETHSVTQSPAPTSTVSPISASLPTCEDVIERSKTDKSAKENALAKINAEQTRLADEMQGVSTRTEKLASDVKSGLVSRSQSKSQIDSLRSEFDGYLTQAVVLVKLFTCVHDIKN